MIEKRVRIAVSLLLLLLLGGSHGIAQEPLDVLKTNGLVKSGKFFVLPEEEKVLQGLFNMRPVMGLLEGKYTAWAAIIQNEYEFQQLGDYKILITGQFNDFKVAYNNMPQNTPQQRFEKQQAAQQFAVFDNELRMTNSELALRQKRLASEAGKQKAENDAKQACETFLQAKGRLWPDVDALLNRYDELKKNDSVLNALRAYNAEAQAHLKIGPSDDLSKKAKQVITYERTYSPETAPQPKKMQQGQAPGLEEKARQASSVSDQGCDGGPMSRESGQGRTSQGAAHPSRGAGSSSCPLPLKCYRSSSVVDPIPSHLGTVARYAHRWISHVSASQARAAEPSRGTFRHLDRDRRGGSPGDLRPQGPSSAGRTCDRRNPSRPAGAQQGAIGNPFPTHGAPADRRADRV